MILQKLKKDAEGYLGETVKKLLLQFRHTSTMLSVRQQRMPVRLQA